MTDPPTPPTPSDSTSPAAEAARQHAINKETQRLEDRDHGDTVLGMSLILGLICLGFWIFGSVPGPLLGVTILSFVVGLAYKFQSQ